MSQHFRRLRAFGREVLQTACLGLMAASMIAQPLSAADIRKPSPLSLTDQKKWREPLSQDEAILHLVNRITFGARPGDQERVRAMGAKAFLDEQLHPERIGDSAIEARVAALPTLAMTSEELAENYPPPKQAAKIRERTEKLAPPNTGTPQGEMNGKPAANNSMMEPQGPRRVIMELAQEEVLRAVYSNRQLQELMVQFWMNHFNIFAPKGADRWLTTSFERDTIRPRALGKFQDLLVATAQSPAMLFYLDNWLSATPNPTYRPNARGPMNRPGPLLRRSGPFGPFGGMGRIGRGTFPKPESTRPARVPPNRNRRGLNENYAREVMELHTLGVEGGYTQKDVIEVARCLTGWTIDRPQRGGEFIFRPQMHDFGEKVVLGHKIRSGRGMEDGMEVLHILAHHPSTAHFISLKLCRRFVADDPPPALVDRASKAFLKTDGDLRQVLKTILTSPEFYSQAAYRAKVKSPLELVASSMRSLGAETDAGVPLLRLIARMGQPMFQYQAPTGFPDRASTWINSGSLLVRINFATLVANNRIPGTQVDLEALALPKEGSPPEDFVQTLASRLVGGELSAQTRDAVLASLSGDTTQSRSAVATAAGLLLASPEFQRR